MTLPQAKIRRVWDSERGTRILPAEVNDFALLRRLPRLHTLHLNGCADTRISIASPSLRVLDLSRAGKHCFIHSVACPMLTAIYVRDSSYGTGIRRVVRSDIKWAERSTGGCAWRAIGEGAVSVPAAGNTWVAPHHEDHKSGSFRVIPLPAVCTVHFH